MNEQELFRQLFSQELDIESFDQLSLAVETMCEDSLDSVMKAGNVKSGKRVNMVSTIIACGVTNSLIGKEDNLAEITLMYGTTVMQIVKYAFAVGFAMATAMATAIASKN